MQRASAHRIAGLFRTDYRLTIASVVVTLQRELNRQKKRNQKT